METSAQIEQTASAAQATMRRHAAEKRIQGPKVVMPGGRIVPATEYLQNLHRTAKQSSTFADVDSHPEKYLKDPRPGFRYLWVPTKNDAESAARIRSGRYIEITQDEMLDDTELPYVPGTPTIAGKTHTGVRKTVEIYDLKLCAVSPKVWTELFEFMQNMAVAKIASDTDSFFANVESEGAVGDVEVQVIPAGQA